MKKSVKFSPEVQERAVRMVVEAQGQHDSQWAAIDSIAGKIGCTAETLRRRVRQHERDTGRRGGADYGRGTTYQKARTREPRAAQGQRDPEAGQRVFRPGGDRPPAEVMRAFVDLHRHAHGVEPICRVLQIAASGYRRNAARQRTPALCSHRARRDAALAPHIERVWRAKLQVYGARKIWRQLHREGHLLRSTELRAETLRRSSAVP